MARLIKFDNPAVTAAVERIVSEHSRQKSCLGIVLYGSQEAVIRLLVVSDGNASFREAFDIDGVNLDLWHLSRDEVRTKVIDARDIIVVRCLMRGKVLFERAGAMKRFVASAKDIFVEGPKRISHREQDAMRLKLSRLLIDVRSNMKRQAYPETALLLMSENFLSVLEMHFRINRWWPGGDKFLLGELRNRDPRTWGLATAYLRESDPARKFAAFAKITTAVLDKLGGPLTDFASRPYWGRGKLNMLLNPIFLVEAVYRQATGRETFSSRFDTIARFAKFLAPYKLFFIEVTVFSLFSLLLTLPIPFLTQYLFDSVLPHRNFAALYGVVAVSVFLGLAMAVAGFFQNYYVTYVNEQMTYDITFKFYRHLFNLTHSFYDEEETGQVIFRFQDATEALKGTTGLLLTALSFGVSLVVVPVVAFLLRWDLALLTAAFLPFTAATYALQSHFVRKHTRQITAKHAEFTSRNYESIAGIKTILSLNARNRFLSLLRRTYLELRDRTMRLVAIVGLTTAANAIVTAISAGVFMAYAWHGILSGTITVGELMAFSMLGGMLFGPITTLITLGPQIQQTLVRAERFFEIYDIVPDVLDDASAESVLSLKGDIVFDNVSFEYEMGRETLKNISVTIREGETVALVGPSGSGKSTFASLIPRFYDPTSGVISIAGRDIRKIKIKDLRARLGYVPQEDFLFGGTVRENLVIGSRDETYREAEMVAAAKAVGLDHVIDDLPLRYDTPLGEAGARFSGGERKRISLARTLLRDPDILILDETTSQIDQESERAVLDAIREIRKGRTTILIAHRVSTIREADRIIVFDEGRIVEEGSHDELDRSGTRYQRLFAG